VLETTLRQHGGSAGTFVFDPDAEGTRTDPEDVARNIDDCFSLLGNSWLHIFAMIKTDKKEGYDSKT